MSDMTVPLPNGGVGYLRLTAKPIAGRSASVSDLVAALLNEGGFVLEPNLPFDWYVDGQLDRTIMPGRYLVVPLEDE